MEIACTDLTPDVIQKCRHVQRHVRLAISDWYYFLSRMSLSSDTWLYGCDWWMKNVPSQLDIPWAFESIADVVRRPGMLDILIVKVDEICISIDRNDGTDFPDSVHKLRDSLKILQKEMEDAGMAV